MKNILKHAAITFLAVAMLAACSKEGGDGVNPFGPGGGATNSALVGKWTSASATGTVSYSGNLGASLAQAVNGSMTTYVLDNVSDLQFDADGKVTLYDLGAVWDQGKWSMKGNTLTVTTADNESIDMNISLSGSEFTLDASDTVIAGLVAWAIGNAVLQANGYGGMEQAGVQVTRANLAIKFKKKN